MPNGYTVAGVVQTISPTIDPATGVPNGSMDFQIQWAAAVNGQSGTEVVTHALTGVQKTDKDNITAKFQAQVTTKLTEAGNAAPSFIELF